MRIIQSTYRHLTHIILSIQKTVAFLSTPEMQSQFQIIVICFLNILLHTWLCPSSVFYCQVNFLMSVIYTKEVVKKYFLNEEKGGKIGE